MKKVLFLNKSFFGYDRAIVRQLRQDGYEVLDFCYETKTLNLFERKYYSYKKINYSSSKFNEYIDEHVCKVDDAASIDIVLSAFLTIDSANMQKMRKTFKNAKFINCIFDDVTWYGEDQFEKIRADYDELLTYYDEDAKQYGMKYNPNFYPEECIRKKEYNWAFIGTAPQQRESVLRSFLQSDIRGKYFLYIYRGQLGVRDKVCEKMKYLSNGEKIGKYIHYASLSHSQMQDIFSKSRCILDIQHPWQKGLSMRPFHAMGMHNKLITSNADIMRYDFYNPRNIWVMDYDEPQLPNEEFIFGDYVELPKDIYEQYSLAAWCRRVEECF